MNRRCFFGMFAALLAALVGWRRAEPSAAATPIPQLTRLQHLAITAPCPNLFTVKVGPGAEFTQADMDSLNRRRTAAQKDGLHLAAKRFAEEIDRRGLECFDIAYAQSKHWDWMEATWTADGRLHINGLTSQEVLKVPV